MTAGLSTPNAFAAPLSSSAMPPPPPSSTPGSPKVAYERAFRAWSSANVAGAPPDGPGDGPLTYQVYTPADLAAPRSSSLSRPAEEAAFGTGKASMATRAALVVLGLITVLGTAAVVLASTDDAPRSRPASAAPEARATGVAPTVELAAALPAPSGAVTIEPADDVAARPVAAAADKAVRKAPAPGPSARTRGLAPDPWAPASTGQAPNVAPPAALRSAAPPPNPYGGTPASVLRPPPGYRR